MATANSIRSQVRLKDILRPVKEALWVKGINCSTTNESMGSSFVKVRFHTAREKDVMVMKIDCRDLAGHEADLRRQIFNLIMFHDANYMYLTRDEIEFLENLFAAPSFTLRFTGDVSDVAYGLEGVNALQLRRTETQWEAALTNRGQIMMETLMNIEL